MSIAGAGGEAAGCGAVLDYCDPKWSIFYEKAR